MNRWHRSGWVAVGNGKKISLALWNFVKVITPQNRIQEYSTYLESSCHIMPLVCGAHGYSPKVLGHLSWAKWIISTTGLPSLIPRVGGIQPFDSLSDMFKTIIHIDKMVFVFLYIMYLYIYIHIFLGDMIWMMQIYSYIHINSPFGNMTNNTYEI